MHSFHSLFFLLPVINKPHLLISSRKSGVMSDCDFIRTPEVCTLVTYYKPYNTRDVNSFPHHPLLIDNLKHNENMELRVSL